MTTLTLSLTPEEKRYIKTKAALADTSMKDLILSSIGWSPANGKKLNQASLESITEFETGKNIERYSPQEFTEFLESC